MSLYRSRDKGSVLILVLWALFILAALAVAVNAYIWPQLNFAGKFRDRAKMRCLAKAGAKRAIAEIANDIESGYDALKDPWSNNEAAFKDIAVGDGSFSVMYQVSGDREGEEKERYGLVDEERKININKATQEVLRNFFQTAADADSGKAAEIAASIVDWRDADDKPLENGAETSYYAGLTPPYPCKNADFQVLDEVSQVKGMTPEIFEATKERMTVYGLGAVNMNTADETVLRSLGMTQETARKIVAYRKGGDGEEATEDDPVFDNTTNILPALMKAGSFSSQEISQLSSIIASGAITVRSDNFTGRAAGKAGIQSKSFGITFTFNRNKVVKYWRED